MDERHDFVSGHLRLRAPFGERTDLLTVQTRGDDQRVVPHFATSHAPSCSDCRRHGARYALVSGIVTELYWM
jgi:hypothetical protein